MPIEESARWASSRHLVSTGECMTVALREGGLPNPTQKTQGHTIRCGRAQERLYFKPTVDRAES